MEQVLPSCVAAAEYGSCHGNQGRCHRYRIAADDAAVERERERERDWKDIVLIAI